MNLSGGFEAHDLPDSIVAVFPLWHTIIWGTQGNGDQNKVSS